MTPARRCIWAAVLFVTTASAQAAGPALIPTNLAGTFTIAAPPDGFDVLQAADAELVRYAFPPRPPRADHKATASWERAMRGARHRLMPVLEQTKLAAGPVRASRTATAAAGTGTATASYTSQNWSAEGILNQATSYGASSYWFAAAWFNVPVANQAVGACTGNWDRLFTWVGLDGWTNNEVFQAGTESDAYCDANGRVPFYSAWYEWFPSYAVRITNLQVSPGDAMVVWVVAASSTNGSTFVADETTGNYAVVNFSAPLNTYLIGNSAEWVQERPTWYGVLSTLTNYTAGWMSTMAASEHDVGGVLLTPGSPGQYASTFLVTMLDDGGGAISYPQALGGSGVVFFDEGSAR